MAIKIANKFVVENIENEKGEKIGEIKFNPKDSKIISKLSKIMNDLEESIKKMNEIGKIPEISKEQLDNIEDFEKTAKDFEKIHKAISIENEVISNVIDDLSEIFGKETIECFTSGTHDITSLMPLLDFVTPYIKNERQQRIDKYTNKNDDVMR